MTELEQKAIDTLKTFLSAQTEAGFDAARKEARAVIEEAEYARAEPVNARLVEALKRCRFDSFNMNLADLEFCRSALAAAEAQQAKPVRLTEEWIVEQKEDGLFLQGVKQIAREIEAAALRANGFKVEG